MSNGLGRMLSTTFEMEVHATDLRSGWRVVILAAILLGIIVLLLMRRTKKGPPAMPPRS